MTAWAKRVHRELRAIPWLYALSARGKAAKMRAAYAGVSSYYATRRPRPVRSLAPLSRLFERKPNAADRHVFFLGTDEQQDRAGLLQAVEQLGRVSVFTRSDGAYGQNDPAPPEERRRRNTDRLSELFEYHARRGDVPDLLIAQTWAGMIDPNVLARIKSTYGTAIINIAMDDRHAFFGERRLGRWTGTYPLIPVLDLALTAAPECVTWYEKEGCPARFFPEGSDPELFRPMPELGKDHDVCFVGARYGVRERVVEALRRAGINVAAFGFGWEGGRLEIADMARLFARSRVVLGIGAIGHCRSFVALKLRDFDAPMSGSLYLTQHNPDLAHLYALDREIATYRTTEECVQLAKRFLSNERDREAIAAAGRERALRDHTWNARFSNLVSWIGSMAPRTGIEPSMR